MKKFEGTPGEWIGGLLRERGITPGVDICAADGSNVAIVLHEALDRAAAETKANARLIASAPELLELLQKIVWRDETYLLAGINKRPVHSIQQQEFDEARRLIDKIIGD